MLIVAGHKMNFDVTVNYNHQRKTPSSSLMRRGPALANGGQDTLIIQLVARSIHMMIIYISTKGTHVQRDEPFDIAIDGSVTSSKKIPSELVLTPTII